MNVNSVPLGCFGLFISVLQFTVFTRGYQIIQVGSNGDIGLYSFDPKYATVKVGEPVAFKWVGQLPHNVQSSWISGLAGCETPQQKGQHNYFYTGTKVGSGTYIVRFLYPGDVHFICTYQCIEGMFGTIRVIQRPKAPGPSRRPITDRLGQTNESQVSL